MNNPQGPVYDIHPIKKGKKIQSVRVELRPEELPKGSGGARSPPGIIGYLFPTHRFTFPEPPGAVSLIGILGILIGILGILIGILGILIGILGILGPISYITRE